MMFYGQNMAAFLEGFGPAQSLPYLPDMARLELALRHSYHGADSTPIAPDALAHVAPDALPKVVFGFAPTVHLLTSRFPIASIWRKSSDGKIGPRLRPFSADQAP